MLHVNYIMQVIEVLNYVTIFLTKEVAMGTNAQRYGNMIFHSGGNTDLLIVKENLGLGRVLYDQNEVAWVCVAVNESKDPCESLLAEGYAVNQAGGYGNFMKQK